MRTNFSDWFYSLRFMIICSLGLLPDPEKYMNKNINGYNKEIDIDAATLFNSIGDLPYDEELIKKGWKATWFRGRPLFRFGFPWNNTSDRRNINLDKDEKEYPVLVLSAKNHSGNITFIDLYSNFAFQFPVYRTIAKLNDITGVTDAIWGFSEGGYNKSGLPENDFEHCGQWKKYFTCAFHWGWFYKKGFKKGTTHNKRWAPWGFRPTEMYYCFEHHYTPYWNKWKINGVTVRKRTHGISTDEIHMIWSIGGGDYCQGEIAKDSLPANLSIKRLQVLLRKE